MPKNIVQHETVANTNDQTEEEKRLLRDAVLLWVAVRMSSTTEWVCGDDELGMSPITDPSSPYWQHTPLPSVMSAQGQIIAYPKILKPLKESVVRRLHRLSSAADPRKYWFTIYLTYFFLLHSCALGTRRNEEYARQINAKVGWKNNLRHEPPQSMHRYRVVLIYGYEQTRYANPGAISKFHQGLNILLLDFHQSNKGQLPFALTERSEDPKEFEVIANLNEDQVLFMRETTVAVREMRKSKSSTL